MLTSVCRKLDRRIGQGITKITWQNRNMIDIYVKDCCVAAHEVHTLVKDFKECKNVINKIYKKIANCNLIKIDKNQIYEGQIFQSRQNEHRQQMINMFDGCYNKLMTALRNVYKNFKEGSPEVQREWRSQIMAVSGFPCACVFVVPQLKGKRFAGIICTASTAAVQFMSAVIHFLAVACLLFVSLTSWDSD